MTNANLSRFILHKSIFVFDDLYFIDLVVVDCRFIVFFCVFFSPSFDFDFLILAKGLAGKSVPEMIYLVTSGMLNLNSVSLLISIWMLCTD